MNTILGAFKRLLYRARHEEIDLALSDYHQQLEMIRRRGEELQAADEEALRQMASDLRERAAAESLDALVAETFAVVREAAHRATGMRPYDEQLLAGLALHDQKVVEMQTGEGKTLAAVMPACLHAFCGRGVHVLTFNDYLSQRDAQWMGPVYRYLGLTVGYVTEGMSAEERRAAYRCDVTYVTAKESGFDFLRDQLCMSAADEVHREFHCAIVDEADSILIDEARVPLVVAGATHEDTSRLRDIARVVKSLESNVDYETDTEGRNVHLTSTGPGSVAGDIGVRGIAQRRECRAAHASQPGAASRIAAASRCRLHRTRRACRNDRRVHGAGCGESTLALRSPGGDRGEGASRDTAAGHDSKFDHAATLLGTVRADQWHDGHGASGRRGVS